MNQRFRELEGRVRQLEKELRHSLQAKPQDAQTFAAAPFYEATPEAQAELQHSKQGKGEPPIAAASAVSTSSATTTTTTATLTTAEPEAMSSASSREYSATSVAEDLLGEAALPSSYAATVPMTSGAAEEKSGSFDDDDNKSILAESSADNGSRANDRIDDNNDEAVPSSQRRVGAISESEAAPSDALSAAASNARRENGAGLPMAVAAADAVPVSHNNAAMCLRQVQHWRCERVRGPGGAAGVPDAAADPSGDLQPSTTQSGSSSALATGRGASAERTKSRGHRRDLGRFVVSVVPVFAPVNADPDPEFNAIYQRRANAAVLKRFYDFLCDVLGRRAEAAAAASSSSFTSSSSTELESSFGNSGGDSNNGSLLESSQEHCDKEMSGCSTHTKFGQQQQLELLWCDGPVRCLDEVRPNQLGLLATQATSSSASSAHSNENSSNFNSSNDGTAPAVGGSSSSAKAPALSESFRVLLVGGPVPIGWVEEENASASQKGPGDGTERSNSSSGSNNHGFEPLIRVLEELSTAFYVKLHDEPGLPSPCKRVQVFC